MMISHVSLYFLMIPNRLPQVNNQPSASRLQGETNKVFGNHGIAMGRPGSHTNPTEIQFLWDLRLVRTKLYVSGRYAHGKYNKSDTSNLRARKIKNCVSHIP